MKPRLLPDTRLIPSEGGVVICGPQHTAALGVPDLYPWIERLRPFLDGGRCLEDLVAGLPPEVAGQVGGVVELLVREGFVRDAAADEAHTLSPAVRERHAAMIDFIELQSPDSPERRFERYRRSAPVVVGSGRLACAVALALLQTGVEFVRLYTPGPGPGPGTGEGTSAHVDRLVECAAAVLHDDPEARLQHTDGDTDHELDAAIAGAGALLFCADAGGTDAVAMAARIEALASRTDTAYGRILVANDRASISAVGKATTAEATGFAEGSSPAPDGRESPYLAGPTAALAAHQLCLHLLGFAAGLGKDGEGAELDLATARFDQVRAW
ncbi:hypothetical protein KGQ20_16690 [Catenulispora sp. NF23]|uniref:hypothetical protein n=1 Tax=Catenulispora pinistramenti TaxID=2705254 RepID=UPI001BA81098|nr:hypothetical protein [Catenulispora pinistramenti]MBS2534410.1 hypothetical protein [Catenulispora pinistramenti]